MRKKRSFDTLAFLTDYAVDHRTHGHKHCSAGWVQIKCPFCTGNPGYHLGINMESGACNCRRCGRKDLRDILKAILGPSKAILSEAIARYGGEYFRAVATKQIVFQRGKTSLPSGLVEGVPDRARNYLIKRHFNVEEIIKTWKLRFTGPTGPYKFRIIAPIYYKGKLVSYQGRDYSEKVDLRYKACAKENEVREHQSCLYGEWLVPAGGRAVVIEGITDTWRLGPGAVGTFGTAITVAQLRLLLQYRELFFLFDPDPQAQIEQKKFAEYILMVKPSIQVNIVEIENGDPGELTNKDAKTLMKDIFGKIRIENEGIGGII